MLWTPADPTIRLQDVLSRRPLLLQPGNEKLQLFHSVFVPSTRDTDLWRIDVNALSIRRMCFRPEQAGCSFHLVILEKEASSSELGRTHGMYTTEMYVVDQRKTPLFCDTYGLMYSHKLYPWLRKVYRGISDDEAADLRSWSKSCTFFTVQLYVGLATVKSNGKLRCAVASEGTWIHPRLRRETDPHVVHVWYTRESPSLPWKATVMDPNYASEPLAGDYDNQIAKRLTSLLRRYHKHYFTKFGVEVDEIRHSVGLNVNAHGGICYSGLCLMLLLLPLSPTTFKNGAEALAFALRVADALGNSGYRYHFIESVLEGTYKAFVNQLFSLAQSRNPVLRLVSNPMAIIRDEKVLTQSRSRSPSDRFVKSTLRIRDEV